MSKLVGLLGLGLALFVIATYVPVFATRKASELVVIVVCFALMTAAWCAAGFFLVNHQTFGAPIRR